MLIKCDRHTEKDLELWESYEEADLIHSKLIVNKEKKSLKSIWNFLQDGDAYISVSWGKDSVVIADIALRHGINIPIVHLNCIPSHNINCDLVRDKFLKIYPNTDYQEFICDYGAIYHQVLPDYIQDKETDKIWYKTWEKVSNKISERHISGVRAKESATRKIRMMRWGENTKKTCAPIGGWTTQDVFAYLAKYNLPVHPNYGMLGGGRWNRNYIRVAEIGDIRGTRIGRIEWEKEYYSDILRKLQTD